MDNPGRFGRCVSRSPRSCGPEAPGRVGRAEIVPIAGADALDSLRHLFEKDFRGAGTWDYPWPDQERDRLRKIVSGISYWASDGDSEQPHALRLDESRIRDADEAWIPVLTPDGRGVLVWLNSD